MSPSKKLSCKGRFLSVWGPLPHNSTPQTPTSHTLSVYTVLTNREGGGGEIWTRAKVREATVDKAGSKIPTWLTLFPVYKLWQTPGAKFLYRWIFLRWWHFALVSISLINLCPPNQTLPRVSSPQLCGWAAAINTSSCTYIYNQWIN